MRSASVLAMAALLMAGCGGDDGDDESATSTTVADTTDPPTTTEPTTTTTEPRTPEEEVEEAYWEAERVLDDLLQAPDPDDPRLPETRVDPILGHITANLKDLQEENLAVRFAANEPPPREIISLTVSGETATVTVCQVDNTIAVDVATNEVIDDGVLSALIKVNMLQIGGLWKVSDTTSTAEWHDGRGCDR